MFKSVNDQIGLRYCIHRDETIKQIRNEIHMQIAAQCLNLSKCYLSKNFVSPSVFEKNYPDQIFKFKDNADFIQINLRSIRHYMLIAFGWGYEQVILINSDQTAEDPDNIFKKFVAKISAIEDITFKYSFYTCYFELDSILKELAKFVIKSYYNFFEAYASIRIIANNDIAVEERLIEKYKIYSIKNRN